MFAVVRYLFHLPKNFKLPFAPELPRSPSMTYDIPYPLPPWAKFWKNNATNNVYGWLHVYLKAPSKAKINCFRNLLRLHIFLYFSSLFIVHYPLLHFLVFKGKGCACSKERRRSFFSPLENLLQRYTTYYNINQADTFQLF